MIRFALMHGDQAFAALRTLAKLRQLRTEAREQAENAARSADPQ